MNVAKEHIWFNEQIATYLAGGLQGDERARFETHASECGKCAAELDRAAKEEQKLNALFADATPAHGFEDRIIRRLRTSGARPRMWIHPLVVRIAATAAAVALVGGVGYVASEMVRRDATGTSVASDVRIGQAWSLASYVDSSRGKDDASAYSDDAKGNAPQTESMPSSAGLTIAGGQTSLNFSYANPYPERSITVGQIVDDVFAGRGNANNHDEDHANQLHRDGHVGYLKNPFSGVANQPTGTVVGQPSQAQAVDKQTRAGDEAQQIQDRFRPQDFSLDQVATAGEARALQLDSPKLAEKPQVAQAQASESKEAGATAGLPGAAAQEEPPPSTQLMVTRKVIRNGEIEFEVDSFDSAVSTIMKVVAEEAGFIATTNSAKLDNGKVKGTIVVRVPPDHLDTLVLKLRALGELKRQNLSAQDVTKLYTDLESELRAARAMEDRLIEIIKTGKGEIKDLLAAEKELANWRGKIEKILGEINYYNNQIALSTLSIGLMEKNITTAGAATEREDVNAGVEADDVESARAEVLKSLDEAKGRINESELKKLDAGQLAAKIVAEVKPENAGRVIDRLKQIGKVARLDIQRKQTTPDGATPAPTARLERKDTRLVISLYNLANVAPRQTTNLNLACEDVETVYQQILARVEKAGGRIVSSNLNRAKSDQINGTIQFEVKSAESGPVLLDARGLGEVMRLAVTENPDTANVTTAKQGFAIQLFAAAQIAPRETVTVQLAATDVSATYQSLIDVARERGRILTSQVNEQDRQNVTGTLELEIPRDAREALEQAIAAGGDAMSRNVIRSSDTENTIDSKLRIQISLIGADRVPPRESMLLGVQAGNVDASVAKIASAVTSAGGRVLDSTLSREGDGRTAARMALDVPLGKAPEVIDQIRSLGEVRTERSMKNAQVPEGLLSRARIEVALATPQAIVSGEKSVWGSIREGLGTSFAGLMWSLQILVVGLCFVVPWGLLLWGGWKLLKRTRRATAAA